VACAQHTSTVLEDCGIGHYTYLFEKNDISLDMVVQLRDENELAVVLPQGMTEAARKKLIEYVQSNLGH